MPKKRKYRATDVKNVALENVLAAAPEGPASAGVDVVKFEAFTVLRWQDGSCTRPRIEGPWQIRSVKSPK